METREPAAARFWIRALRLFLLYFAAATVLGWSHGVRGIFFAWWVGGIVFSAHFLTLLHDKKSGPGTP